jgi:hypothetical protein
VVCVAALEVDVEAEVEGGGVERPTEWVVMVRQRQRASRAL